MDENKNSGIKSNCLIGYKFRVPSKYLKIKEEVQRQLLKGWVTIILMLNKYHAH